VFLVSKPPLDHFRHSNSVATWFNFILVLHSVQVCMEVIMFLALCGYGLLKIAYCECMKSDFDLTADGDKSVDVN